MISNDLLEKLIAFRRERDWEQYHTVRNLCSAICVEASELLDIFRWARDTEVVEIAKHQLSEIESEVADVAILLTYLCHDLGISIEKSVSKKIEANRQKYPVNISKGISTKYTRLA